SSENGLYSKLAPNQGCTSATLEWVDWFNHRRLLEPIGSIPPAEAEERYYAMINTSAIAA
ncbi:MAG: IS3 family transposase, partial [Polymorphobacter sp.]